MIALAENLYPRVVPLAMNIEDQEVLRRAVRHLEYPSLAARISNLVGTPIEMLPKLLPVPWSRRIHRAAEEAMEKALSVAVAPLHPVSKLPARDHLYHALGITSGALGGLFGLAGLLVELPVTTLIMLQSIAEIARSEGEDLSALETRIACVQVFALGGRAHSDDAAETGYYGVRLALAGAVSAALSHLAHHGLAKDGAPVILALIRGIGSRFGILASEKAAAQFLPLIGAAGAALVNSLFIHHFQEMARSHFSVRRLERKYGMALVRKTYDRLYEEIEALEMAPAYARA